MTDKPLDKDGWPVDGSALYFEDLTDSVRKALRQAYSMQRKNRNKDIKYTGPDHKEQATCPPIRERLKAENLAYDLEDQGRSALDIIIGHAIQLGIEQGRRITKSGLEYRTMELLARVGTDMINERANELKGADHGQNTTPQT